MIRGYMATATSLLGCGVLLLVAAAPRVGIGRAEAAVPQSEPERVAGVGAAALALYVPLEPRLSVARESAEDPIGDAVTATRLRLEAGANTPAREVDRWAVRLAERSGESQAALARYAVYRPLILDALRRHRLPGDLAFLPWVESEWKPEATSRAGAAGLWQFMPGTARMYGLEVSSYVDERRDPVRSTDAAARHLADLRREMGDWHTALAAYNAGTGRVGRSIGHGAGSFWRGRSRLPAETRNYVPHVLAAARVGRRPAEWGLEAPATSPLDFQVAWTAPGTTLTQVAELYGTSDAALRALNPHLIRGMTPPDRRWAVRIPLAPSPVR